MASRLFACLVAVSFVSVACGGPHSHEEKADQQTISITRWTERTELFVEFPVLVVGKETPFAAHLTDLKTFKPVSEGALKVSLTPQQGKEIVAEAQAPAVAGIYRPVVSV